MINQIFVIIIMSILMIGMGMILILGAYFLWNTLRDAHMEWQVRKLKWRQQMRGLQRVEKANCEDK